MKSLLSSTVNIILVASMIIIIYILILNSDQNSQVLLSESADTINNYTSRKISIKQLDSLSASSNFHFSNKYVKNLHSVDLR